MSDFLPPVVAELRGEIGDLQSKLSSARKEISQTTDEGASRLGAFGKVSKQTYEEIGAVAIGAGGLLIHAADKLEKAHVRLETAIENNGQSYDDFKGKVSSADSQMEKLGFTADQTETALGTLTTVTGDANVAINEMANVADLARYKNISLSDAGDLVGKIFQGNSKVLKTLGLDIDTTALKHAQGAEKVALFGEIMDKVHVKIGGQAAAYSRTLSGEIDRYKATVTDFVERNGKTFGTVLVTVATGMVAIAEATPVARSAIQAIGGVGWGNLAAGAGIAAGVVVAFGVMETVLHRNEESARKWADSFVTSVGGVTDKTLPQISQRVNELNEVSNRGWHLSLAGMELYTDQTAKHAASQRDALNALGISYVEASHKSGESWAKQAVAAGATSETVVAKAAEMRQALIGQIGTAIDTLGGKSSELKTTTGNLADGFNLANEGAKNLKQGLDALIGVHVNAVRTEVAYNDAVAKLTEELFKNKATLDLHTQAGRDNSDAISAVVGKIQGQAVAMREEGASTEQVNAVLGAHITQLRQVLANMGFLPPQIDAIIQRYGLIPPNVHTEVTANTAQARGELQALANQLGVTLDEAQRFRAFMQGGIPAPSGGSSGPRPRFFAAGGVVDRPTLAVVGEKAREVILPLNDMRRSRELLEQSGLMSQISGASGGSVAPLSVGSYGAGGSSVGPVTIIVQQQPGEDGRQLAERVRREFVDMARSTPGGAQNLFERT